MCSLRSSGLAVKLALLAAPAPFYWPLAGIRALHLLPESGSACLPTWRLQRAKRMVWATRMVVIMAANMDTTASMGTIVTCLKLNSVLRRHRVSYSYTKNKIPLDYADSHTAQADWKHGGPIGLQK